MVDPTPPTPPQPATPATPGKPAGAHGDEVEGSPLELLRQNAGTMVAILVAVVAIAVLLSYRSGQSHQYELQAWEQLAELRKQQAGKVDGFPEAAQKFAGTDAEPFIRVAWAARLYESGERAKVERALELYKQVLAGHKDHILFGRVLPEQVALIEAELASPRAHLIKVATPEQAEQGSGPPSPPSGSN